MENNREALRAIAVSVGKRLKEAREKKSLTIEQIQKQTKIHSSVLIALEEGRASELLTDTYVRSFLKQYTKTLGLPNAELLKEYFPPHAEQAALNIALKDNPLPEETKTAPKILYFTGMAVLGIAALLIIAIIGGKLIAAFSKAISAQQQRKASIAATTQKKASKSVKPTAKKLPIASSGQFREAKKTAVKTNSESKDMIPKSTPLSLVINVKEPVLVKLTRDGVLIFSRVMAKGLVEKITANESIELEISKSRALEITLNGRPIALPAKNNIFSLEITRKGVKIK